MYINFNQGLVYWYSEGDCFENRDTFETVMSIHGISKEVVHCYAILGKWSERHQEELRKQLKSLGYKIIIGYFPTGWIPKNFIKWHDCHTWKL